MQYQLTICQGEPSRLGDPANAAVSAGCLLFLGMVQLLPGRGAKSQNCQVFCNVLVSINGNLSEVLEAPCSESALSISTGWAGTKFAPFVQLDNRDPVTIGPRSEGRAVGINDDISHEGRSGWFNRLLCHRTAINLHQAPAPQHKTPVARSQCHWTNVTMWNICAGTCNKNCKSWWLEKKNMELHFNSRLWEQDPKTHVPSTNGSIAK